jgi:REP element-mobilizing transposase RayT
MVLNEYGQIAYNEWEKLQQRFTHVDLDVFQIMPNHIHAIIALTPVGATLAVAHDTAVALDITKNDMNAVRAVRAVRVRAGASPAPTVQNDMDMGVRVTVSDIVGAYKSLVANGCLEIYKIKNETMGQLWQRNYYEHIIRNEQAYQTISEYIINNPEKWAADKFYTL